MSAKERRFSSSHRLTAAIWRSKFSLIRGPYVSRGRCCRRRVAHPGIRSSEVEDLEATVPQGVAQHRSVVAKTSPFLFPFQAEDVARMAVKNFGYLGYEQAGGKTVTAAAWATTRGFRRVLVVCQSSLVENWISELGQFGFERERLTTHAAVTRLQEEKRRKHLPDTTTFYVEEVTLIRLVEACEDLLVSNSRGLKRRTNP
jgi:hypothetical protein